MIEGLEADTNGSSTSLLECDGRISRRYPWTRKLDDYIHGRRLRFNFKHLYPHIPRSCRLLDVGAGDGLLIQKLAKETLAVEAHGIDIEERSLGDFRVEIYDGKTIPFADQSVDVTLCVTVLHHCEDSGQVLNEIRRVTCERFLLVEDRFDHVWERFKTLGWHYYLRMIESMPFRRDGFRSTSQWCSRLEQHGFEVLESHLLGAFIPGFPATSLFIAKPV